MKGFTNVRETFEFKTEWIKEDYDRYMNEITDLEKSLDKVNTPYAILSWWWLKEMVLKSSAVISGDCRIELILLAAILENEVKIILHKHFTEDVINEYVKKFTFIDF